ncbi:upstream activation factor subunit spp27-like isoform X1 [Vigna unguiculata]|uniref:upstream activation factor subunit spp27-like isoform X1 n=1 Tax=Vigna unguiculata TaxID=3917 RepID=UPI0010162DB7|nr:upstream activation factor subunit spp27-like isoform X1 [Vigna unguiculata]
MVSESELIGRLREFLRSSDLNTTTTATVRRQLEADFGIDLSHRKAFIREQVDLFLQTEHNQPQQQPEQDDDVPKDEEEEDAPNNPEQSEPSDSKEESEEDDDEEERDKPKHAKNAKKNKGRSNKLGDEVAKKRGGGFCKLCSLSPQLQEFMGAPEMARTEVVKQIWAYIREKNLQDPNNRRNIICDDRMRALFNVNSINMFQMNKALSKHIWPLDSDDVVQVKSTPKEKQKKQERDDDSDEEPKRKEKRQKGAGKSGFLAPLQLSDALVNFLGTGESELSRTDVIKRMWDYIKGNNLQMLTVLFPYPVTTPTFEDPSNKRQIICDEKLKELFDVDSFNGFTVTKLLAPHFIKTQQ